MTKVRFLKISLSLFIGITLLGSCASTPETAQDYYIRAATFFDEGDYDAAIEDATEAILLDPTRGDIYSFRGFVYRYKDDYDYNKAIEDYTKAIDLGDDSFYERGTVYADIKEYDKAMADFNEGIKLNPTEYYCYAGRASVYQFTGEIEKAIEDYTEAIKLYEKNRGDRNFTYYYERGVCYSILAMRGRDSSDKSDQLYAILNKQLALDDFKIAAEIAFFSGNSERLRKVEASINLL